MDRLGNPSDKLFRKEFMSSYLWARTFFGNPKQALQYLDECREELLSRIPTDYEGIPDVVTNEWIALLYERDRIFQQVVQMEVEELFEEKILQIHHLLSSLSKDHAAYPKDPIWPCVQRFQQDIRTFVIRKNLNIESKFAKVCKKTVDVAMQTEVPWSRAVQPALNESARSGNDAMDDYTDCVWHPTASSTPLKQKVLTTITENWSPIAHNLPLKQNETQVCSRGMHQTNDQMKDGLKLGSNSLSNSSPKKYASKSNECGFGEQMLCQESKDQNFSHEENELDLDLRNITMQRSFSVPANLEQHWYSGTSLCSHSGLSSISGLRSASVSSVMSNLQPFGRHLKTMPWKPVILQQIPQECSNCSKCDHEDSID